MNLTKGQIIIVTRGEYSDYGIKAEMLALQDFNIDDEIERFKASDKYLERPDFEDANAEPDEALWAYGSDDRFMAWGIARGLWEDVGEGSVVRWHIGSYGRIG